MRVKSSLLVVTLLAGLGAGCAAGPRGRVLSAVEARDLPGALDAYDHYRELDGPDGDLLADVAELLLEEAAIGDDEAIRDAAVQQLILAGTRGEPALWHLAEQSEAPVARARALEVLARRSRGSAKATLYGLLDSDDPDVMASAITAVDPEEEPDRLVEALGHTAAQVRTAAALALSAAAPHDEALRRLTEASRVDPDPTVRNAAVRALGAYGAGAFEPLRERLSDPEGSVRLAAVRALVQIDRERALLVIGSLLETPPSTEGIEAARVIAFTGRARDDNEEEGRGVMDARAYLRRALVAGAPNLRSQAAVALLSLPADPDLDEALQQALRAEQEPGVRMAMASALLRHEGSEDEARQSLREIAASDPLSMPRLQAAGLLAADGEEGPIARLAQGLESDDPALRRVAARALAREAMRPDDVRGALRDGDALVRVHAAGGVLSAAAGA